MCKTKFDVTKEVVKKGRRDNVPFEKALDLTGYGNYNRFIIFVCSITMLASVTELFGLSFIVQASACDLGLNLEQRGLLSSIPMLGIVFSAYFWGYFTDIKGRRTTLLCSMTVASLASFLSSFSPNMATLAFFKFISVTFASASFASTYTLLGEFQPMKYRDKCLILLTCANVITEGVMVAISYPLLSYVHFEYAMPLLGIVYKPWRLLIVMLSLLLALSAICLIFTCESSKFLMSKGRDKQAMQVLRKMYAWNNASDEANYPVDSLMFDEEHSELSNDSILSSMWSQCIPLFRKPYLKNTFIIYYMIFWICFISNSFTMWLPYIVNKFIWNLETEEMQNKTFCPVFTNNPIISNIINGSETVIDEICIDTINVPTYVTIFAWSVGGCIITAILALLVKWVSKNTLMVSVLLICTICGFIIYWISFPMVGLTLFFVLNYEFLATGLILPIIVDVYPTYIRGMAGCLSTMIARIGAFLGIYTAGISFEPYCEVTFFIYSFILLTCIVTVYFLPKITTKSTESLQNEP